ncbi:fasciclin domain-containing protein [Algoriphagus aquimarinus]|uniref:Fasciclin domain-containing protein n=1 Tax=Algoriphagus aquimarinus TaxID=237018 RepID=A0A5C7B6L3_9BACT|nr:fasciclin domain-containing protein [Algoriphagus aquimarinus]TXE14225.1 fasciclin domain-containing protein [Algoriphagus aquimarinus]
MKKLGVVFMMAILVVASSFSPKSNPIHETRMDADIVDLAISQDFLTTLVAAVKAGDLVETLKGDGPFTVFAPTNEAFAKLPAGTIENLLKPENKAQLVKILTYHVVPGKILSSDLKNGQVAKTAEGSSIKVTLMDGKAMINNATVTTADIMADNGVVHIIDTVIMPPM